MIKIDVIKIDDLPIAVLLVNSDLNIVAVNNKVESITGYTGLELVGNSVNILVQQEYRERHTQLMKGYLANPEPKTLGVGRVLECCCKNGDKIPVEISLMPVENSGFVVIVSLVDVRVAVAKSILKNIELVSKKINHGSGVTV